MKHRLNTAPAKTLARFWQTDSEALFSLLLLC